jgi:hypothetical protein
MKTAFPVLLLAGILTAAPHPQSPVSDWAKEVEKACTSPRYGLRLAASKKVAQAGDAAVAAVRAFAQQKGKDALPVALVEAYGDLGGNGEAVLELLVDWAKDREFFWRAQALRGLSLRSKDPKLAPRFVPIFAAHEQDPAWLMRVYARLGLALAPIGDSDAVRAQGQVVRIPETDPRARTKLAAQRQAQGLPFSPVDLLDALFDERTFLGDPWGRRRAQEAIAALQAWLGDGCGFKIDASVADNQTAVAKLVALAAEKSKLPLAIPPHHTDVEAAYAHGIEILSCKNGDLFLRWTADGRVLAGLDDDAPVTLSEAAWRALSESAAALQVEPQSGVVICDKLRISLRADSSQGVAAPGSLAPALADWLKQLAAKIEEAGNPTLASALSDRLQQFVAR